MDVQEVELNANARVPVHVPGRFFMLIATSAPVTVRFKRSLSTFREVARDVEGGYVSFPGDWTDRDDRFDGVEFVSTVNQTITIGISDRAADYRRTVGVVQVEGPNDGATAADQTIVGAAAAVTIAAANADRLGAIIVQNVEDPGGGNVRVALGATATAALGKRLAPGQSVTFHSPAAVTAFAETVNVKVSVTEETRT